MSSCVVAELAQQKKYIYIYVNIYTDKHVAACLGDKQCRGARGRPPRGLGRPHHEGHRRRVGLEGGRGVGGWGDGGRDKI